MEPQPRQVQGRRQPFLKKLAGDPIATGALMHKVWIRALLALTTDRTYWENPRLTLTGRRRMPFVSTLTGRSPPIA
jgi:hypothetical protein